MLEASRIDPALSRMYVSRSFMYDGNRIGVDDTPEDLNMEDGVRLQQLALGCRDTQAFSTTYRCMLPRNLATFCAQDQIDALAEQQGGAF